MTVRGFIDRHGVGRWLLNFVLIVVVLAGLVVLSRHEAVKDRQTRYAFCVKLEQVRAYARGAAERGLSSLPTLSYYKHHPREKKRAIKEIRRQIDYFSPPLDCKRFARELSN